MSGAFWEEYYALTDGQKAEISRIITTLTDEQISAIERLISRHKNFDEDTYSQVSLTPGELKKELKKLRAHYQRALNAIENIDRNNGNSEIHSIDQDHVLVSHSNTLCELYFNQRIPGMYNSGLERITREVIQAIDSRIESITVTKEQNSSRRFAFFIIELAEYFEANLPSISINTSDEGLFLTLTNYILCDILKAAPTNAKRQIAKALDIRAQHQQK